MVAMIHGDRWWVDAATEWIDDHVCDDAKVNTLFTAREESAR